MGAEPFPLSSTDYSLLEGGDRALLAAQGYAELTMFDEALRELEPLPEDASNYSSVVELRTVILMQAKRWTPALLTSRELCRREPGKSAGFIHTAFCLHELGETNAARDTLLDGPEMLRKEPTFHYNLACYECALGNLELARMHLDRSFKLNKKFRDFARTDPDLAALRG